MKIVWWNAFDFFHYDPKKAKVKRWPNSPNWYQEKCKRVDAALQAVFQKTGEPEMLALGEITNRAARELRDRILPNHELISLDVNAKDPTLQVALLYSNKIKGAKITEQPPFSATNVPKNTRHMIVVDITTATDQIRCVICHWTAKIGDNSENYRDRIASDLSIYAYDFLRCKSSQQRHLIVVGDLNDEPNGIPLTRLNAHMHRSRSRSRPHWSDRDVKRIHLYNCAWRLHGEANPHAPTAKSGMLDAAGTFYWEAKKRWSVVDHLIVSGSLLTDTKPYLNEANLFVAALPQFYLKAATPIAFRKNKNKDYEGLSDHLPVCAEITL